MGEVYFYHLTRRRVEEVLRPLLARSLGNDWKVVIRGRDPRMLTQLDEQLWLGDDADFLPHGMAGGDHDGDQPILLTTGDEVANCLISVDGAEISADQVAASERSCILFDGLDDVALTAARAQWKSLTQAGCKAKYWSEESGNWQMKAEA